MKLNRIGCGLLAIILSLSFTMPFNSYASGKFSDTKGHWAESYINTAVNGGFVGGYPDGTFLPDKAVTRAEFATMINKALGNTNTANLTFNDVSSGDWYYNDVSKAVASAYASGYSDSSFKPNSPITRQEAAVMLARIVPAGGGNGNLQAYPDYSSIADWADDAMEKINGENYIGAYNDGNIHPLDQLTRAQTAKIICEIIKNETIVTAGTTVKEDDTKLSGKIYSNSVTIHKDLGEDSATIENCVILGSLTVQGGGVNTITLNNTRAANVVVDKDTDPVRILAKGETAIAALSASESSVLQTSSLSGGLLGSGFNKVDVNGSAEVTLKGSFPKVNIVGTKAKVTLDSGTISDLVVTSSGKYSDITAESGATISDTTVNAESYFHGTGTISHMEVNADNVTYETKPKNWTIASSAETPDSADPKLDIAFSPTKGATKVKLDSKITITFTNAMEMSDGDTISSSDIKDFIELRKSTASGSKVGFSASINSSKKVITITPDPALSKDTKYYLILEKNAIRDGNGEKNEEQTTYFTTGDNTESLTTTYSPANGSTGVSVNPSITITFSDDVVRYSNGATISSSDTYLKDCIVFRKTSSSGDTVSFNASINSSKKVVTITPKSALTLNQKYYIGILSNSLKEKDSGDKIPSSSVTWTTGVVTPVVDVLTLTPDISTITANVTSNIAGTAYLVALPSTYSAINANQVITGQNASNVYVDAKYRTIGAVAAGTSKAFTFSDLDSNTQYTVYAVINGNSLNSAVKSASAATTKQTVKLSSLEVIPTIDGVNNPGNQISFSNSNTNYNVALNSSINTLRINATGAGNISIDGGSASANNASKDISLSGTSQTILISITKDGASGTTYKITVDRTGNTRISSLSVTANGGTLNDTGGRKYALTTNDEVSITVSVIAEDKYATVILDKGTINSGSVSFTLPASTADQTYDFSISSGSDTGSFTITFDRPEPQTNPDPVIDPPPTPTQPTTDNGSSNPADSGSGT